MALSSAMCGNGGRTGGGDCSHGVCSMVAARQLQFQRVLELVKVDMERNICSNDHGTQIMLRRHTQTSTMQMRNHLASKNQNDALMLQSQSVLNALSQQIGQVHTQLALQNREIHGLFERWNVQEQLLEYLASNSARVSSKNSTAELNGDEVSPSNSVEIQCNRQPQILPSISNHVNATDIQGKPASIRWLSDGSGRPHPNSTLAKPKDKITLRSGIGNNSPHRQPISHNNASSATLTNRGDRCYRNRLTRKDKGNPQPKATPDGPKVLGENGLQVREVEGVKLHQSLTVKDIAKLFLLQRNELDKSNPSQKDLKTGKENGKQEHQSLNMEDLAKLLMRKTSELTKFEHELKARWFSPETQPEVVEPAAPNSASIVAAEELLSSKYDEEIEYHQRAELGYRDGNSNFLDENTRLTDAILEDVLEDVSQEVASFCDEYVEHLYLCEFMSGPEAG